MCNTTSRLFSSTTVFYAVVKHGPQHLVALAAPPQRLPTTAVQFRLWHVAQSLAQKCGTEPRTASPSV